MTGAVLEHAVRAAGGRIVAALAARFRDLDLAEEAFGEACMRAVARWPEAGAPPVDPAAWLYRAAERIALDGLRKRRVRERLMPDPPEPAPNAEEIMLDDAALIPDERLRLIFICCHPAIGIDARAALTLRLVCGLTMAEIARAFLLPEATVAQRLTRAKRKIAEAGVSYDVPRPEAWPERLDAVLSTLEVAYSKAHEDAAGAGPHAGYAAEMLSLSEALTLLLPDDPEVLAFAAIVRFAEARRPARIDGEGGMVPLAEQNPLLWRRFQIEEADQYLEAALAQGTPGARVLQAAIHAAWCRRKNLAEPAPWRRVLELYDLLLERRDDVVVRLNRAVALGEMAGPASALAEIEALAHPGLEGFLPYQALRADLLRRLGRAGEADAAYANALALEPGPAERVWLERRRQTLKR